jgi:hypothetical protein
MELLPLIPFAKRHFNYRMTHSVVSGNGAFPFAVTTAAARNPRYENQNNQDAVGICITPGVVVGLVCDGCASTHPFFEPHSGSNNEVGAKLACSLVLRDVEKVFSRREHVPSDELVERLSHSLLTGFRATVRTFCGRDEVRAERFIFDYLMTTVVGFVVTEKQFVVCYSGDGVIAVNGELDILDREEGSYFANDLLSICCPSRFPKPKVASGLKVYKSGEAKDLQSILVATDGMAQFAKQYPNELTTFLLQPPAREQCNGGFDFALPEFRRDIAWNPKLPLTLSDDAAFALVRRISQNEETPC